MANSLSGVTDENTANVTQQLRSYDLMDSASVEESPGSISAFNRSSKIELFYDLYLHISTYKP